MSDGDSGTPFSAHSTDPIDDWSRAVFDACLDWAIAGEGRWFRSDEGWIRLRIDAVRGEPLEPLFAIELDTADHQINLDFGSWCTPISASAGSLRSAAVHSTAVARELIESWLRGEVKLASYSDETGWRGSKIIESGALPAALEPVPASLGERGRAIVKTWRRTDWRAWRHLGDALWIECDVAED
ncbi:hypothetical protein E2493_15800 [Sphingomonas parva]|uniref:Uncharacterized protein n=1 Tax=Sphingomonas parva TaxID=2555898 RepID=A0A4Y8ZPG0_9SPHN|nr:hypothetical protein [Sphingomonas parva]TFI57327.1 hypothetical protein E2493_15800 [Sphingomonas parva]